MFGPLSASPVRQTQRKVRQRARKIEDSLPRAKAIRQTPTLAPKRAPVFGPLEPADRPLVKARNQSTRRVKKAIRKLPKAQQKKARADLRRSNRENTRRANAQQAVRDAINFEKSKGGATMPDAKALSDAVRFGYTKHLGGSHLLQRNVSITRNKNGTFDLKMDRRFLPDTHTQVPTRGMKVKDLLKNAGVYQQANSPVAAAGAKVLEVTARPSHAVAAGVDAALRGKGVGGIAKAEARGLAGKDKTNFGKILKSRGVPAGVASVAGFGLDVGLDPTTYITGGAGSVARKAAEDAAKDAEKRALKLGLTKEQAARHGQRAARKALKTHPDSKGITVKVAGHEVPGVRRATAKAGRGAKKAGDKAPAKIRGAAAGAKNVVHDVRPSLRPSGVPEDQFLGARRAARTARATRNQAQVSVEEQARALQKALTPDEYERVIHAVETQTIGKLPERLRRAAVVIRSANRHALRVRKRAGVKEGEVGGKTVTLGPPKKTSKGRLTATNVVKRNQGPKGYFPHAQEGPLREGLGLEPTEKEAKRFSGGSRRVAAPGSAGAREIKKPVREANKQLEKEGRGRFSTDIPLVHLNYQTETARVGARAQLLRDLAKTGRHVKPGSEVDLKDGEAIYHLGSKNSRFGLEPVDPKDWSAGKAPKNGQFVVLHKKTVEDALRSAQPAQAGSAIGRVYDKGTRGFKRLATATPGFHARNLVGDTQMAYLSQPGHRLPGNLVAGGKALRALSRQEKANRTLTQADLSGNTIKVAGKQMPVSEFLAGAKKHGVIRSGFIGRELEDLGGKATKPGLKRVPKGIGRGVKRLMQNREDVVRLSTYKHGLDRGMSPAEAADLSLETHIDYGDLTEFERKYARRAAPFYTFSARALPLHAKRLVTNPGKFANYEKLREEVANATGLDLYGTEGDLNDYQQRQLGVLIKHGGKVYVLSDALPLTMLNELPIGLVKVKGVSLPFIENPLKFGDEFMQFVGQMLNPTAKMPFELYTNKSLFFRDNLENPDNPLVAAPSWVAALPASVRKELGIVHDMVDKKTGKKQWGWPGKVDYVVKSFPGPLNAANRAATVGTNRIGQQTLSSLTPSVIGARSQPVDKNSNEISRLYDQYNKLAKQASEMRQRGINADKPTKEYTANLAEQRRLKNRIYALSKKSGYKIPIGTPPAKGKLSPQQQLRQEFKDFQSGGVSKEQQKLRKEFEQFTKGGG